MELFENENNLAGGPDDANAFEMLHELELNRTEDIRRQRAHFRLAVKVGVTLSPGNASDLLKFKMKGTTGDVSEGGCCILFPMPVRVGDVYRIEFDRQQINLPLTFARCLRCRMLKEDAYEVGFSFFSAISLPESATVSEGQQRL